VNPSEAVREGQEELGFELTALSVREGDGAVLTAEEFSQLPEEEFIEHILTDAELLSMDGPGPSAGGGGDSDEEPAPSPAVRLETALTAGSCLLRFVTQGDFSSPEILAVQRVCRQMDRMAVSNRKQLNIEGFMVPSTRGTAPDSPQ
jgi:hypothetical protein